MKLSLYQVICIYFVLQANALLKEPKKDPKDILPSDFEQYEFETVTPIELEIETSSSSSSSLPAETSRPDGLAPVYGQMSPGKPIWQCWYEKLPFRNRFHITAVNWNMSEGDVKSACKKSDAMTFWDWKEHRNAANAQSFTAEFSLPIKTADRLEDNLKDLIEPFSSIFKDLPKFKCRSNKPDYPLPGPPMVA